MHVRLKDLLVYSLAAVASFLLGLFILDQVILPRIAGGQRLVEVPEVVGRELQQARLECEQRGLVFTVQGELPSEQLAAGLVLRQDPAAGLTVKEGRQVLVVMSLGPEQVTVPRVRGLTERQARLLAERSRLEVAAVEPRADPSLGPGRVIAVEPEEGSALPAGSPIRLVVSKGVEQVAVPSVVDKELEEARRILTEAGLQVGQVSHAFNRFVAEGRVIDQLPLERTTVERGALVDLVVSRAEP